jgi:hypothetical protein
MKKTILALGIAFTFPFALLAEGPDGGKGAPDGPAGPGGPHHKHHGPGDGQAQGQGQGQDNPDGAGKKGGGCQKGKGGPKSDKPDTNNN